MAKINKVQEVAIGDLIPYERNAKLHSKEQVEKIAESISEFGYISPILIDENKNILAGHGRVEALKRLEIEKVPCVFIEGLTEEQRRAYILADNRLTELGDWDMELVQEELTWLNDQDFNIDLTGFDISISVDDIEEDNNEDLFEDIEKLDTHYGVPYQGNKSRIADLIIKILPEGKRLVDLFGGVARLLIVGC